LVVGPKLSCNDILSIDKHTPKEALSGLKPPIRHLLDPLRGLILAVLDYLLDEIVISKGVIFPALIHLFLLALSLVVIAAVTGALVRLLLPDVLIVLVESVDTVEELHLPSLDRANHHLVVYCYFVVRDQHLSDHFFTIV